MKDENPEQNEQTTELSGVLAIVYSVVTTLVVCGAVLKNWQTYGIFNKLLGVFLVLNLLFYPMRLLFAAKQRVKVIRAAGKYGMDLAYIWVLLATLVFTGLK